MRNFLRRIKQKINLLGWIVGTLCFFCVLGFGIPVFVLLILACLASFAYLVGSAAGSFWIGALMFAMLVGTAYLLGRAGGDCDDEWER